MSDTFFKTEQFKSKPHEALQSLVVTTSGQPCIGCLACTPHDAAA